MRKGTVSNIYFDLQVGGKKTDSKNVKSLLKFHTSNQDIPFNPYPVGDQLFKYEELQKPLSFKLPHYTP